MSLRPKKLGSFKRSLESNWVEAFLDYSHHSRSAELWRLWAGIHAVSASLGRKVWVTTDEGIIYPNFFAVLVGRSGYGKSRAIEQPLPLIEKVVTIALAPTRVTKESLYGLMAEASEQYFPNGFPAQRTSYNAQISELGVFLNPRDVEFMYSLNELYDCRKVFEYIPKNAKSARIEHVFLNILAGTTVDWFHELPTSAFSNGFAGRLVLVYADEPQARSIWGNKKPGKLLGADLAHDLEIIHTLEGEYAFDQAVIQEIEAWYTTGLAPWPEHARLDAYRQRRITHFMKLMIIHSASRTNDLSIQQIDFNWAQKVMLTTERAMIGVADRLSSNPHAETIEAALAIIQQEYARTGKPVAEETIRSAVYRMVPLPILQYVMDELPKVTGVVDELTLEGQRTYKPPSVKD